MHADLRHRSGKTGCFVHFINNHLITEMRKTNNILKEYYSKG